LLLHGFAGSWRAWSPVLGRLEAEHAVLAPTLPGHTGGPALPHGVAPSVYTITDAVERMLDSEGIERTHVVGNSMGGWLAFELARRGRARSVVALSPGGAWDVQARMALVFLQLRITMHLMRLARDGRADWLIRRARGRRVLLRKMCERGERISASDVVMLMSDIVECPTFEPLLRSFHDRQLESLDGVDCPMRIAWAERDRVIPHRHFAAPMRERVPQAEFLVLPGVGHVPMQDDPALVATTILEVTRAADAAALAGGVDGS
jgi:pimeloyl-ACP methyl ester carboxylesterase